MTAVAYTADQFAAAFPRARSHETADLFVSVEHSPKQFSVAVPADMIPANHKAIKIGYTNASRTRTVTRFAIVPAAAE